MPGMAAKGLDRLVIHPSNPFKNAFDIMIIVCVLYTSITAPVKGDLPMWKV